MNILNYTDAHHQFRKELSEFLEKELMPQAGQWEMDHIVPKSAWKKMGVAGYLCTNVPEAYGGHGLDFLYSVIVAEEVSKAGLSGLVSGLHSDIVVPYIVSFGSEEQKLKYLPGCISGDIITAVNRRRVVDLQQLTEIARENRILFLLVQRGDRALMLQIR